VKLCYYFAPFIKPGKVCSAYLDFFTVWSNYLLIRLTKKPPIGRVDRLIGQTLFALEFAIKFRTYSRSGQKCRPVRRQYRRPFHRHRPPPGNSARIIPPPMNSRVSRSRVFSTPDDPKPASRRCRF